MHWSDHASRRALVHLLSPLCTLRCKDNHDNEENLPQIVEYSEKKSAPTVQQDLNQIGFTCELQDFIFDILFAHGLNKSIHWERNLT